MLEILELPQLSRYTRADTVQPNILLCSFGTASSTAVLACLSANYHFRHSCLWWKHWCHGFCPSHLHNEDMPCMSTTSDVLSLVSAWLSTSGLFASSQRAWKKRKTLTPCILQSAFSPPEQPLCRENAPSLRSLGKISLSHTLFAIVKELLGVSWAQDLLLCFVAEELEEGTLFAWSYWVTRPLYPVGLLGNLFLQRWLCVNCRTVPSMFHSLSRK